MDDFESDRASGQDGRAGEGLASGFYSLGFMSQGGNFLLLNRPFYFLTAALLGLMAFPVPLQAATANSVVTEQVAGPAPAASPAVAIPLCSLEGEIGEGRGRITARGAGRGYAGELVWRISEAPEVVFTVISDFVPYRPAVDIITLSIGPVGSAPGAARLAGAFGSLEGYRFSIVRGPDEDAGQDRRWFDELASGSTLTASVGTDTVGVTWTAESMEADYNLLLDLLQLVAGWEIAGLCLNRAPAA